jgi:hypothetical protein
MKPRLEEALAYLLDLRLRCRGNPDGTVIVDRCLALLAQAETETADTAELQQLEVEIEALRVELADRFGPPPGFVRH